LPDLLFERQGPLAVVTFNRPEARNAMTFAMYEGLVAACESVDQEPEIRVLILRGAGGKAFVAGTDISQFQAFQAPEDALQYEERISRVVSRLEAVTKPTIAAIEGFAVGGGASLALACDLRYATPESKIGVPIARTLGNCLAMENYARILDLLGPARTKEMIFRARLIEATEAHAAGLFNAVVPAPELWATVQAVATEIAGHAPITIRVTKEAIRRIQAHRRAPGGEDLVLQAYMSDDFKEGVRAFLEKRKPVWTGR